MVLKTGIEKAFASQQALLKAEKPSMERTSLKEFQPNGNHIEVITGIRRCGKSTLMNQIKKLHYPRSAFFNFEDSRIFGFEVHDFPKLDEVMPPSAEAYFFDEIQNVETWEVFIRQLHDRGAKIFITGSNASLLSRELGTRLTGRNIRHEIFPFSYAEFLLYKKKERSADSFWQYLQTGGFPEFLASGRTEMLQNLMKDIVLRDIAVRHGVRNTKALMDITFFLLSNTGKECTYNSLKNNFGLGSANTASDYLNWLEDSYLLFFLQRFSWSAKNSAVNPRKVYCVDNGMAHANTFSFSEDKGRMLENAVFLHLRRQTSELYYFRENKECDFVVMENRQCKQVIQCCWELNGDNKMRETAGLLEAMDYFNLNEGTIVTMNQSDTLRLEGKTIHLLPAHAYVS